MGGRPDYKQILAPEDFAVFVRLRQWRKEAAEEEGVPLYTIFTNEQLAEMARRRPQTKAELGSIDGVGEARLGKYGEAVLALIGEAANEALTSADPEPPGREGAQ